MSALHTGFSQQNGPEELEGGTPGVALMSVTKEYEGHKVAVQELTLTFHRDQITALLGTNGAGKTTIMCVPFSRTYFPFPLPLPPPFSFPLLHPLFLLLLLFLFCFDLRIELSASEERASSLSKAPPPVVFNHILDLE